MAEAQAYYRDVKARVAGFGRDPSTVSILPGTSAVVGSTEEEAERLFKERQNLVSIEAALRMLGRSFNDYDFTQHDLDAPFPILDSLDKAGLNSSQGAVLKVTTAARAERLSLREVALRFATPRTGFVGTPEQIADKFQEWLETGGSDGFVINESLPGQFRRVVEHVIPILQKRGLFREEYAGSTLRSNLGLAKPENSYTAARRVRRRRLVSRSVQLPSRSVANRGGLTLEFAQCLIDEARQALSDQRRFELDPIGGPLMPKNTLANAERWATDIEGPAHAIDDSDQGRRWHRRRRL